MASAASADTKEQLLNVAEQLIAERGYAGTTVRAIANQANANLAAVNYHFGSKEELFRAIFSRIAKPIVVEQLAILNGLQKKETLPSIEEILTAFLKPCFQKIVQNESFRTVRAQFMGRCWSEPEPLQSIASGEFMESRLAFLKILQQIIPDCSQRELNWKLDLVIATMIRVQNEAGKPDSLLKSSQPEDVDCAVHYLVRFLTPGMSV
ncbi:TetR/AcrR family transcriptional regulator [Leptolyngbyaceae cyanobacterium CCMR0082]|uniref:TetR/AcrR family transcriptional regulator n=1 Tax=Adonisia turfae CCMR0082 TaxID=2304604 RepID=A0A6M0S583_9CYAN|nr:TetR/AcrR family transcriptional regulator [Adonisia turfae]NEZ63121.1 TetR/AcrR family transcriptional regulator [Adonisia turfae CCMR0082]